MKKILFLLMFICHASVVSAAPFSVTDATITNITSSGTSTLNRLTATTFISTGTSTINNLSVTLPISSLTVTNGTFENINSGGTSTINVLVVSGVFTSPSISAGSIITPADPEYYGGDYTTSVWGVVGQGQSLRTGGKTGSPTGVTTAEFPEHAFMLRGGPIGSAEIEPELSVVALRDGSNANITYESAPRITTASSAARHILTSTRIAQYPNFKVVYSGQAWPGKTYDELKKGGTTGTYETALDQITYLASVIPDYKVRSLEVIHGEGDGNIDNMTYDQDLAEWRTNMDTDVKVITGQSEDVLMFFCQSNSSRGYGHSGGVSETAFPVAALQYDAHEADPTHMILVAPKYWLPYADYVHITNEAQRALGEKYGEVYNIVIGGGSWLPLKPTLFTLGTSTFSIDYNVPFGEITIDTSTVASVANYGFDYVDDFGRTILSVTKTGPSQITVTLSGSIGTNAIVSYAYHNGTGSPTSGLGERGNIRDQDTTASVYDDSTIPLYNWGVTFREALN